MNPNSDALLCFAGTVLIGQHKHWATTDHGYSSEVFMSTLTTDWNLPICDNPAAILALTSA